MQYIEKLNNKNTIYSIGGKENDEQYVKWNVWEGCAWNV